MGEQPTYQSSLLRNRWANVALDIGHKYRKPATWMHETARLLCEQDSAATEQKGMALSDDHLRQIASKLAKK
jgi:hypothetical protein